MSLLDINMKKTMSITIAILLTLSILGVTIPAMISANAGTVGTLTLSDSVISGNRVIKITVTDPDISAADAEMPSVTCGYTVILDTNQDGDYLDAGVDLAQPGNLIPTYQITGGTWIGFVTIATTVPAVPATADFPVQQAIGPAGTAAAPLGTADEALAGGITAEPDLRDFDGDGTNIPYRGIIAQLTSALGSTLAAGTEITITYNDADPSGAISVTLTVDTITGSVSVLDRESIPPGGTVRVEVNDMDMNLNPLAADVYTPAGAISDNDVGVGIGVYGTGVSPLAGELDGFPTLTETGPNTGIFRGSVVVDAGTAPPPAVLMVDYQDANAPDGASLIRSTTAEVATNTGSVALNQDTYVVSDVATVTVVDPDLNLDPITVDFSASAPATGTALTAFPATHRFVDTNGDGVYTRGETIILDNDGSLTYTGGDTVVIGTPPAPFTALTAFPAANRFLDTVTADGAYTVGEAIINDADASGTWTAGDTVILAGYGSIPGSLTVISTSDPDFGFLVALAETGVNTGIFTGDFYFAFGTGASTGTTLNVQSADIISVAYADAATATSAATTLFSTTATFATNTGVVSLDRSTYTSYSQVATVTVVDPDLNTNALTIQSIDPNDNNVLDANEVRVQSTTDTALNRDILLTETGANTDTFTGHFTFTAGAGSSATDQPVLSVANGDLITVSYRDAADANGNAVTWQTTATFSITTYGGTVEFSDAVYSPGETIEIYVTDPDLNTDSGVRESYAASGNLAAPAGSRTYVVVTTATGGAVAGYPATGIAVQLTETGADTGVFWGTHTLGGAVGATDIINAYYQDAADAAGNPDSTTAPYPVDAVATVTTNTGTVSLDKNSYVLGETITITVNEPDLNLNPLGVDNFGVNALGVGATGSGQVDIQTTTSGTAAAIRAVLTETDINTGIFTVEITTSGVASTAGSTVLASRGDTLTVTYHDALNAGGIAEDRTATASILATTATVTLDKDVYHLTGNVEVTVYDPDMNVNPAVADSITVAQNLMRIMTTTNAAGTAIALTETGPDTSTFTASFQLGTPGFPVTVGDSIWAQYTDLVNAALQRNTLVTDTATVTTTTGTVEFDKENYQIADTATITLTDMDLNSLPTAPETYATMAGPVGGAILVTSTSDPAGLVVSVTETGPDTGVFTVDITFTTGTSSGTALKAQEGDTITAMYRDWTPAGVTPGTLGVTTEDVFATAILGAPIPELPIVAGTPDLQDVNGNPITAAEVGTTVLLATELSNAATLDQPTLYIVQVKDAAGTVVFLGTASLTIPGGYSTTFSVSWTPDVAGTYTVEVFAWESWTTPAALSVVQTSTITVE